MIGFTLLIKLENRSSDEDTREYEKSSEKRKDKSILNANDPKLKLTLALAPKLDEVERGARKAEVV